MPIPNRPGFFYQFLGAHSLLIGLLPFFLPVYLWQHGLDLAGLSLLIAVSGVAYVAALGVWQKLACRSPLTRLVGLSFALELLLIFTVGLYTMVPGAALFTGAAVATPPSGMTSMALAAMAIGVTNGLYNACFWTSQRTLFLQQLNGNDAGRQYGNFQIFVTLVLKLGILLGGFLLDTGGFVWLLALSAGVGMISSSLLATQLQRGDGVRRTLITDQSSTRQISLRASFLYQDKRGSRPVFIVDGLFLYLESHFWTLTLFLVVREDFSRLGIAVVLLALVFAVLFFLIKNRIDRLAVAQVYRAAVWLYVASWLLRFTLSGDSSGPSLWIALILITFFSSFFRLAFNKRFFDIARREGGVSYLLIKSYCSQAWLGIGYLALTAALILLPVGQPILLQFLYLPAAAMAVIYLRYSDQV